MAEVFQLSEGRYRYVDRHSQIVSLGEIVCVYSINSFE